MDYSNIPKGDPFIEFADNGIHDCRGYSSDLTVVKRIDGQWMLLIEIDRDDQGNLVMVEYNIQYCPFCGTDFQ